MDDLIVTADLSKFGFRELAEAARLLGEYAKDGAEFLGNGITLNFNTHSGYIFLQDENFEIGMLRDGKVDQWFSCPNCGNEGFDDDKENEAYKFKFWEGACSKKCKEELS